MEELLLAIPLSQPQRHRAHVLPPEGLPTRRDPLRPQCRELPRRSLHRGRRQLLVMSLDPKSLAEQPGIGRGAVLQRHHDFVGVLDHMSVGDDDPAWIDDRAGADDVEDVRGVGDVFRGLAGIRALAFALDVFTTLGNTLLTRAAKPSDSGGTAAGGASRKIAATATNRTRQSGIVLSFLNSSNGGATRAPPRVLLVRRLLGGHCRILRLSGDEVAVAFRLAGDEIAGALRLAGDEVAAALGLAGDEIAGALGPGILRPARRLSKRARARQKTGGYNGQLKRFHRSSPFSPNGNSTDGTRFCRQAAIFVCDPGHIAVGLRELVPCTRTSIRQHLCESRVRISSKIMERQPKLAQALLGALCCARLRVL